MSLDKDGSPTARRVRRLLAALRAEDLEERIAPVKCAKHPDSPECATDYGVPAYGVPSGGPPPAGGGGGGS